MRATRPTLATTVCWIPGACYLCLLTFAARAYFKVGHWPLYGRPDPSELRLPVLYGASVLAYPITVMALVVGMIAVIAAPHRWRQSQMMVFFAGAVAWGLSFRVVGGLTVWLRD